MTKLRRRDFIERGLQVAAAVAAVPIVEACAGQAVTVAQVDDASGSCVDPASESLRNSMQYSDPSPYSDKSCSKCEFFTPDTGSSCGQCVIMSGPVHKTAWCESWSPKG